ncbi:MAG TPA: molybdate ABC transporter permease subunit [Candidatus Sulfotelmatobacter sp.]
MSIDWQAFRLTLQLALVVSTILLIIGLPIAYWIAFSRASWTFLVEAVVALPLVLPPTVLGFYVLVALGSHSPLGRWWIVHTGHTLAFTFTGLVIGSILYSLPFAVQPFASSFAAIDHKLMAASATLGAAPLRTFFRVIVPLSVPGIITGTVLTFAHTMGEFGVVLMVGGNIPGTTRTVSIDIYDRVQSGNYSAANQTALLLLVFCFAILILIYSLNRRPHRLVS